MPPPYPHKSPSIVAQPPKSSFSTCTRIIPHTELDFLELQREGYFFISSPSIFSLFPFADGQIFIQRRRVISLSVYLERGYSSISRLPYYSTLLLLLQLEMERGGVKSSLLTHFMKSFKCTGKRICRISVNKGRNAMLATLCCA